MQLSSYQLQLLGSNHLLQACGLSTLPGMHTHCLRGKVCVGSEGIMAFSLLGTAVGLWGRFSPVAMPWSCKTEVGAMVGVPALGYGDRVGWAWPIAWLPEFLSSVDSPCRACCLSFPFCGWSAGGSAEGFVGKFFWDGVHWYESSASLTWLTKLIKCLGTTTMRVPDCAQCCLCAQRENFSSSGFECVFDGCAARDQRDMAPWSDLSCHLSLAYVFQYWGTSIFGRGKDLGSSDSSPPVSLLHPSHIIAISFLFLHLCLRITMCQNYASTWTMSNLCQSAVFPTLCQTLRRVSFGRGTSMLVSLPLYQCMWECVGIRTVYIGALGLGLKKLCMPIAEHSCFWTTSDFKNASGGGRKVKFKEL